MEVRNQTPHGHTFSTTLHQARDVELGRLGRQLDRSKCSEAEVAAKHSMVSG